MIKKIERDGILVLYKERGITSNFLLKKLKKTFKFKKIGHGGTLDPFAEGIMIIFINRATRISRFFLNSRKVYETRLFLGVSTDTMDSEGNVVNYGFKNILHENLINEIFDIFKGEFIQRVPDFSASKFKGKPMYYYVRKGLSTPVKYRSVFISNLSIKNYSPPFLDFEVECSGGTYVRSLGFDIARKLCGGGHLISLKRTKVKNFTIKDAFKLGEIEKMDVGEFEDCFIPVSEGLNWLPKIFLEKNLEKKFLNGVKIEVDEMDDVFRIYVGKKFLGIGEVLKKVLKPVVVFK